MVIVPGYYKSRNGDKVKVLAVDAPGRCPVVGYTIDKKSDTVVGCSWRLDGGFNADVDEGVTDLDIISEWREPLKVSGWVNVYKYGSSYDYGCVYPCKDDAISVSNGAIATVYVSGEEGKEQEDNN